MHSETDGASAVPPATVIRHDSHTRAAWTAKCELGAFSGRGTVHHNRRAQMIITHSEIYPGTFASTTETADWLLAQLGLRRHAVVKWGPMATQQLSEVRAGKFLLIGYAGNSAPDHVDQLHSLPEYLRWFK